jgi:hypothetical protein
MQGGKLGWHEARAVRVDFLRRHPELWGDETRALREMKKVCLFSRHARGFGLEGLIAEARRSAHHATR